ncbi:MAG TPA: hypothetical protein VGR37_01815, partial [Longimicrobiaceae bacterium]|nr:hypothetical protein [Longimicrobiaceae bacterium]
MQNELSLSQPPRRSPRLRLGAVGTLAAFLVAAVFGVARMPGAEEGSIEPAPAAPAQPPAPAAPRLPPAALD